MTVPNTLETAITFHNEFREIINILIFLDKQVRHVFPNEQRYYELLVDKSISFLCLFPYHLADIVTKGLRVTPFNYYLNVISKLLKNDKSYDTLPNFTAADCKHRQRPNLNT